jgi:hypothetical protein
VAQAHHGSGEYSKVARPILVVPRDSQTPLLDGGQSKQRIGYKHIKTILLFHILQDDVQDEINGEFPTDGGYTLQERRELRAPLVDELQIYDVMLTGFKFSASATADSEYE